MPKKYKLKKKKPEERPPHDLGGQRPPRRELSREEIAEYRRIALFLFGWFILVISLYFAFTQIEEARWEAGEITEGIPVTVLVYTILAAALFIVWFIYNWGLGRINPEAYEKPPEMGFDEFCKIVEGLKLRKARSKYLMILFMPFLVVLLIDLLMIRWGG